MVELKKVSTDIPDDPPRLDPQHATDMCSARILNNVLEGLVRVGPREAIVPGMAQSWEVSGDGLQYKFILQNSKWNDGSDVTAYDFEYSWKRNLDPSFGSQYAFMMFAIKNGQRFNEGEVAEDKVGVKAIDERVLIVTLEQANPQFLSLTTFPSYLPVKRELPERFGDKFALTEEKTVFNGPFYISKWIRGQKVVISKNPYYYDVNNVELDEIHWIVVKDAPKLISMYENNELDMIYRVPNEYIRSNFSMFSNIETGPDCLTEFLVYNTDNPFLKNEKIRKALTLSIDRERLLGEATIIGFKPAYGLIPPGISGGVRKLNNDCFIEDIDTAKVLFEEGISEVGQTISKLVLVGENTTQGIKYMDIISQMWYENLGFKTEIIPLPLGERIAQIKRREFDIGMMHWRADYDDPITYLELFKNNATWNYSRWSNYNFEVLLEKATNLTEANRMESMAQAENILFEEMPLCPLYYQVRPTLVKSHINNIVYSGIGCDQTFKWTTVTDRKA